MNAAVCSCGEGRAHEVARRRTADGVSVLLWSDGQVTGRLGYRIEGVPMVRPRSAEGRALAMRAGRLLMGEVCVHDAADLGALYEACRWVARRGGLPGDVRRRVRDARRPAIRPVWTVLSADRDGRPTSRVWRLPRMRWPGLAVWDNCAPNSGGRGRYELTQVVRGSRDTYESTGFFFADLRELAAHLHGVST